MPSTINISNLKTIISACGFTDIKNLTTTALGVVVAPTKVDKVIPQLMIALREYKPVMVSTRELRIGDKTVFAKNRNMQRGSKAMTFGRGNEYNLMSTINEWMRDYGRPMHIIFETDSRKFEAKNVVKTQHTGATNIFQRLKADIHLVDDKARHIPISIKDDSASYWESVDTYWGKQGKKFLQWAVQCGATALVENGQGGFSVKPSIAIAASPVETRDVVFGNDLLMKGCVLIKKFKPNNFRWDFHKDILHIECSEIMSTVSDVVNEHQVYMQIRNRAGRNPQHLYNGLCALAIMKGKLYGEIKAFPFSDRTKIGI